MSFLRTAIAAVLILGATACSDSPTDPGDPNDPGNNDTPQVVVSGEISRTGDITRTLGRFTGWDHPHLFPGPEVIIHAEGTNFAGSVMVVCGLPLEPGTYPIRAFFGPNHEDEIDGEAECMGVLAASSLGGADRGIFGMIGGNVVIQSTNSSRVIGHLDVTVREVEPDGEFFLENGRVARVRAPINLLNN